MFAIVLAHLAQNVCTLNVDATLAPIGLVHVTEEIPVAPGRVSLFYPKWIPGEHGPTGPLNTIINFYVEANGKRLTWERDKEELFRIDVQVPEGVHSLNLKFDHTMGNGFFGKANSAHLARIKWNRMLFYPGGLGSDEQLFEAKLTAPQGWSEASALFPEREGNTYQYPVVSLTKLVDSPAQIGEFALDVDEGEGFHLNLMADRKELVEVPKVYQEGLRQLHREAEAMIGARHFAHYNWLLTLSDDGASDGLEHHESSEDGTVADGLSTEANRFDTWDLLAHEFFHSYNGKYRRPSRLATKNFEYPMHGDLLWVYEGLTQFFGEVLPTRAGLFTQEQFRESAAWTYQQMATQSGRLWRPLSDTATTASLLYSGDRAYGNARRGVDYYPEMVLVWLEVDQRIRQLTGNKKSINDFCRIFHGGQSRGPEVVGYEFEDVVDALNKVAKYDWANLLRERVYSIQPVPTTVGFELGGWKLVYNDQPNVAQVFAEERQSKDETADFSASLGISVKSGQIQDVATGSPADHVHIAPNAKIVAVNGEKFGLSGLKQAVLNSPKTKTIRLTVEQFGVVSEIVIPYSEGPKYAHLVRIPGTEDRLSDTLKALTR